MKGPRRVCSLQGRVPASGECVWYAAYGSNMHRERLECYLGGGTPAGGARTYPGCRDRRPPARSLPVLLPGVVYFATESPVWHGGRAFYDPWAADEVPAHAYLLTRSQFSDIAAQEMYRDPGEDLDLAEVLARGRAETGPGRYETLVCPGVLDGDPVLTFTAPWRWVDVPGHVPSAAYLRHLASGLVSAHGWSAARAAEYLAGRPGARERWTTETVRAAIAEVDGPPR